MSVIAIILVIIFFVTSVDSAALVVDTMNNGHEDFNPLPQRIFWALAVAVVTAALLSSPARGVSKRCSQRSSSSDFPSSSLPTFRSTPSCEHFVKTQESLPRVRMRKWKKVLPPEEVERQADDDDHLGHE